MSHSITNSLVHELIETLKNLKYSYKIIEFPSINEKLKLSSTSCDNRYEFTFIVNRVVVRPDSPNLKITFLVLYKNTSLMRIDIAGGEHKNCENALKIYSNLLPEVPCPHIHIFDQNFNLAYPLNEYLEYETIETVSDLIDIFIEFLECNHITNLNEYSIQEKL